MRARLLFATFATVWMFGCQSSKDETPDTQDTDVAVTCSSGGQTYTVGQTFPAPTSCDTCSCEASGEVACSTGDADCDSASWCRPTEAGPPSCHPFADAGDPCGGPTRAADAEQCDPSLTCTPLPDVADAAICATCSYEGRPLQVNETTPAIDGCNTCTCEASGAVNCTRIACLETCYYFGENYLQGDSFPSYDGCNSCGCGDEALISCTKIGCTTCPDNSEPVSCFVQPCSVSTCEVEGAVCVDDYCGGCNAYWFDERGHTVCDGEPAR